MRKFFTILGVFIISYIILEVGLRIIFCVTLHDSFFLPSEIIYNYYPELKPVIDADIAQSDSTANVLILSCSVLHKDWVDIVRAMDSCMQMPGGYKNINLYNCSGIGHGSRDNLIKYKMLKDKKFDIVMYYDAINDSRLNNCPEAVFRCDYSQYVWYDEINNITRHPEMNITVVPFCYDWVKIIIKSVFNNSLFIPNHFSKRPGWIAYGNSYKSLPCYESNVKQIMDMARERDSKFLYLTFAYYLPPNYSLQKFRSKELDYSFCDHSRETEIWGKPENVAGFIDSINVNSKAWVNAYSNARWCDFYSKCSKNGKHFADICHFSPEGAHQFAAMACTELDSMIAPKVFHH